MYEFSYDYVKPKYVEKAKLCYMDTDSSILYIKTDNIYKYIKGRCWNKAWQFKLWVEETSTEKKKQKSCGCNER